MAKKTNLENVNILIPLEHVSEENETIQNFKGQNNPKQERPHINITKHGSSSCFLTDHFRLTDHSRLALAARSFLRGPFGGRPGPLSTWLGEGGGAGRFRWVHPALPCPALQDCLFRRNDGTNH